MRVWGEVWRTISWEGNQKDGQHTARATECPMSLSLLLGIYLRKNSVQDKKWYALKYLWQQHLWNVGWCCCSLVTKSRLTFCDPHGLFPARLLCPWDFPDKNTGVGSHFLLQGIFPVQGWNAISCLAGRFSISEPPGKPHEKLDNGVNAQ